MEKLAGSAVVGVIWVSLINWLAFGSVFNPNYSTSESLLYWLFMAVGFYATNGLCDWVEGKFKR